MNVHHVLTSEAEQRIDALGKPFSLTDESFAAFEAKYLKAYELTFEAMSKVGTVLEGGGLGDGELAMSKWMEPSWGIGVVVKKKSALKPELIQAAQRALAQLSEKFVVVVDDCPTAVYIFSEGDVLVVVDSLPEDLRALGLPGPEVGN